MKKDTDNLIQISMEKIEECERTLEKISSTCCMPIRSDKMQRTFELLKNISQCLERKEPELLTSCIEELEQCGSQLGKLYVSCCAPVRAPLYQSLLKQLNVVHTNMHRALGAGH